MDLFGAHLNHPQRVHGDLYHCVAFGYNRCSTFDEMYVLIFVHLFGLKTPIHAYRIGVLGNLIPLMGSSINNYPKRYILE